MANNGFMWECSCGNVVYGDEEPEECEKCGKLDSFIKMPEEIVEERLKESAEEETQERLKPVKKTARRKNENKEKKKAK